MTYTEPITDRLPTYTDPDDTARISRRNLLFPLDGAEHEETHLDGLSCIPEPEPFLDSVLRAEFGVPWQYTRGRRRRSFRWRAATGLSAALAFGVAAGYALHLLGVTW